MLSLITAILNKYIYMKKKFQHLRDMLTIWAIKRFNIQLPDLQQEHTLDTHKVYYYYGRWFRLVPHTPHTMRWIEQFKASQPLHLLDIDDYHLQLSGRLGDKIKIQNTIAAHVCKDCVLARLGLPCRKFYRNSSRMSDVCLTHRYQLIKGKSYDQENLTK